MILTARNWLRAAAAALVIGVIPAGAVSAGSAGLTMPTGARTSHPIGHVEFCKRTRTECGIISRDVAPLQMSAKVRRLLDSINIEINRSIAAKSDLLVHGQEEVWSYPDAGVGDCEDYALQKRRMLNKHGIPLSNLLITVVRKPDGEGHAVLTVRTDKGDYILDNLSSEVKSWTHTGYHFVKRQSERHTGLWVAVIDRGNQRNEAPGVAAIRGK